MSALRALEAVAEHGSVSAAARVLGYTQSAVSRQIAVAEQEVGHRLFERSRAGMRPTREGAILLRHAVTAIRAMRAASAEIDGAGEPDRAVRIGSIPTAGLSLLPPAIAMLARSQPDLRVTTRQASTPQLLRALRAGTLDLALVTERQPYPAPDAETPPLTVIPVLDTVLMLAVAAHGRWGDRDDVEAGELITENWIAGLATTTEPQLGVWPGLPGRPRVAHRTNDWLAKLRLVAEGAGITTVPGTFLADLTPGVRAVAVTGVPEERRRVSVVHHPGADSIGPVVDAIQLAAQRLADHASLA